MRLTSCHTELPSHSDSWFLRPTIPSFTWCTDLEISRSITLIFVQLQHCIECVAFIYLEQQQLGLSAVDVHLFGGENRVVLCNLLPPRPYSGKMSISYSHAATSLWSPVAPEQRNRPFITLDSTSVCSGQTLKYLQASDTVHKRQCKGSGHDSAIVKLSHS